MLLNRSILRVVLFAVFNEYFVGFSPDRLVKTFESCDYCWSQFAWIVPEMEKIFKNIFYKEREKWLVSKFLYSPSRTLRKLLALFMNLCQILSSFSPK